MPVGLPRQSGEYLLRAGNLFATLLGLARKDALAARRIAHTAYVVRTADAYVPQMRETGQALRAAEKEVSKAVVEGLNEILPARVRAE